MKGEAGDAMDARTPAPGQGSITSRPMVGTNDPRFAWIDPAAPVRNYSMLLVALAECWEQRYLPEHRVVRLLMTLLSFLRSDRARGHLLSLEDGEREQALARLPDARLLGGSLAFAALREQGEWRSSIFELQPAVVAGIELGVLEVGKRSPKVVQRLVDEKVTAAEIEERLLWASEFIDDDHWCRKQERDLGLERVALTKESFNRRFGITLGGGQRPRRPTDRLTRSPCSPIATWTVPSSNSDRRDSRCISMTTRSRRRTGSSISRANRSHASGLLRLRVRHQLGTNARGGGGRGVLTLSPPGRNPRRDLQPRSNGWNSASACRRGR